MSVKDGYKALNPLWKDKVKKEMKGTYEEIWWLWY